MVTKKKKKVIQGAAHNYNPIQRRASLMTDDVYLRERVDDQINWHKRKSEMNRRRYQIFNRIDTIVALLVPITLSLGQTLEVNQIISEGYEIIITHILSATAGVYLAISASFLELEGFDRNAKMYKQLYRKLEGEKYKYLTRTEPYDEEDAYSLLIFNVENQLHQDFINFFKASDRAQAAKNQAKEQGSESTAEEEGQEETKEATEA